ncbi:MAG: hypothetical protein CVU96_06110 [Firmicutes bacterium HGW-Firmicutes-20]|nr:MAG: hypothetical protein CVU96_06110 [Firmicutes bacterium HGW-Firmicutes-20]PKM69452.1 MAG: hypothetical protein CVU94_03715 [Firmicutes bacterium HGW-Firmicutes-19]
MLKKDPGEIIRLVINVIAFVVFLIFGIQQINASSDIAGKTMLSILIFTFLFFAIWYELVRYVHRQAIFALNFECDPDKAKAIMEKCKKLDFFNGYKNPNVIFDLLYHTDKQDAETLINLINTHEKSLLKRSLDMLLVYNYSMFTYNRMIDNKTQCRKFHQGMIELKDRKIKGKSISPLYNWEVLDAELHLVNQDYKKAYASLNNSNISRMNIREQSYYYFYRLRCELQLNQPKKAIESMDFLKKHAQKLNIYQQALKIMGGSN